MSKPSKECKLCGRDFFRKSSDAGKHWEGRVYCSISCRNKDTKPTPIHLRFWKYVRKTNDCWLWDGTTDERGYGRITLYKNESPVKAYRLSFEMRNGPIPKGLVVRHKCDNPNCVNPDHLELGTQKDNSRDMVERGRMNKKSLENLKQEPALSVEQVKEIESLDFVAINGRGPGVKVKDVAKRYGVCKCTISKIKNGKHIYSTKKAVA